MPKGNAFVEAECGRCGWLGPISALKEHPTRPTPMDLGFCPECGTEVDDILTQGEADALRASYEL